MLNNKFSSRLFVFVTVTFTIFVCTQEMSLADLKQWASDHMAPYQIPTVLFVVDELPRNTMGKVNKKELSAVYFGKG